MRLAFIVILGALAATPVTAQEHRSDQGYGYGQPYIQAAPDAWSAARDEWGP